MAFKIFFIFTIAVVINFVNAGIVAPAGPVLAKIENFDAVPQYSFGYDVQDALTGDSKAQYETRSGDIVQGSYSLIEADGTRRIVDYTADPINGFNAVVNREPAVAVAPVVARTAVAPAAPIVAAPVAPAPIAARTVLPAPAPVAPVAAAPIYAARNVAAPIVASPYFARNIAAPIRVAAPAFAAPVSYPIPRAVATRLSAPYYNAPYNYAVGPTVF